MVFMKIINDISEDAYEGIVQDRNDAVNAESTPQAVGRSSYLNMLKLYRIALDQFMDENGHSFNHFFYSINCVFEHILMKFYLFRQLLFLQKQVEKGW